MGKIKILVADSQPIFREGLRRILEDEKDLEVVAVAADGEEAVRLAKELRPNIVMINIEMTKVDGIQATIQIKAACPTSAILVFGAYHSGSRLIPSLRAGAAGYLVNSMPVDELLSAIRLVHKGGEVFDSTATAEILHRLATTHGAVARGHELIRPREVDILKLVAKGMRNREIASKFFLSERTIQSHLVNIFRKLAVSSRTEAVFRGLEEGWLTIDDLRREREPRVNSEVSQINYGAH